VGLMVGSIKLGCEGGRFNEGRAYKIGERENGGFRVTVKLTLGII